MRTNSTQISKQTTMAQNQGCVAVATKCGRTLATAQHLDLGRAERLHSRRRHSWHRALAAAITGIQNAWQSAAQILDSAIAGTKRPTKSAFYLMPIVGLVPVAGRRLPVAIAIGMPMPRSADC